MHNQYCAHIWELMLITSFNQIEILLQILFLAVPGGVGNQHDRISQDSNGIHYTITSVRFQQCFIQKICADHESV